MTQAILRERIFFAWLGGLAGSLFCIVLGPVVRGQDVLGFEQVYAVAPLVAGMFMPALSAYAAFWFPADERRRARERRIEPERARAALALTGFYLGIVVIFLAIPVFFVDYSTASLDLSEEQSFVGRVRSAVGIVLIFSPLAVAPATYLTRTTA